MLNFNVVPSFDLTTYKGWDIFLGLRCEATLTWKNKDELSEPTYDGYMLLVYHTDGELPFMDDVFKSQEDALTALSNYLQKSEN